MCIGSGLPKINFANPYLPGLLLLRLNPSLDKMYNFNIVQTYTGLVYLLTVDKYIFFALILILVKHLKLK